MRPEHDESIDRTLAALREAQPPEGLQARVLDRLADQRSVVPQVAPWRVRLAGLIPSAAWLRGAATGAAVAAVALGALFFTIRTSRVQPAPQTNTAAQTSAPLPARAYPVGENSADGLLCSPAIVHERNLSTSHDISVARPLPQTVRTSLLRDASFAPSKPAPPVPLTAQERALLQLVRTATPAELAALNPVAEQKAEAERQAAFKAFFNPSPELLAVEKSEGVQSALANGDAAAPKSTPKEGQL